MAWRFKASKYKNAVPVVPKPENYVRDISVGSYQTYGNNITASAKFMAFNWEHAGSSVAVLPLNDSGRKTKLMPLLHAHPDTVTDLDFSPFHDGLLATASQDCTVKIWLIPEEGLHESISNPECMFSHMQRRVETVGFHPSADCLIHSTSYTNITLWDLTSQKDLFSNTDDHTEVIQSVSWKKDGTLLATSCKDKMVRVFDPRIEKSCIKTANSHQSIKDSRIIWLGETDKVLTTGFDSQRLRQIMIRDIRNIGVVEKSLELDCSTGILMPLYDPDTGMLFLAGKGDSTIAYMEVIDKEPFLVEGIRHSGEQTKGACLVPKRALNVMQGEVNRILQLTSTSVIPVTYQVPRKTYRDFHADLYPNTAGYKTEMNAEKWFNGENVKVPKISLNPAERENGEAPIIPRLGPKPFTPLKLDESKSFDQVFSVPLVPGQNHNKCNEIKSLPENNQIEVEVEQKAEVQEKTEVHQKVEVQQKEPIVLNDTEICTTPTKCENEVDASHDQDTSADSGIVTNTPTSSELKKMFETNMNEENENESNFERSVVQRTSIAERRKMYEHKAMSVIESSTTDLPKGSSVMLRRKGSFKSSKSAEQDGISKEDPGKTLGFNLQKNQDCRDSGKKENVVAPTPKRTSTVFGRVSKFRHLKVTPAHKSQHIENVRNVSRQIPGECDGFHANPELLAVPLNGPGGRISVLNRKKPGKLPDGVIPSLVQGCNIMDFSWDPFDNYRLAVACDDGIIKLWKVEEEGLKEPTNEPEREFSAHADKIYFIKFHPTAKDVLASGSYDMTIKIWDLSDCTEKITLKGHTDQIFSFAWSPCGLFCSTVSKDGKIRVYNPRRSELPVREGTGPEGNRGARIVWALDGQYLAVTGFDKVSQRLISVYKADKLESPLNTIVSDVSPSILIPFYDEDSSTLFLTGKGDTTIYAYEITEEAPYLCPLSHHRCPSLHQGLSFLPKNVCDAAAVEFAVALRLTNNTIEPLSFTVPRVKTELFQDDLFPPTRITWKPALNSKEWFEGKDKVLQRVSLQPKGMTALSDQKTSQNTVDKSAEKNIMNKPFIGATKPINRWDPMLSSQIKEKQHEIQKSMSDKLEINMKLEQDDMEGVDEKEWE